MSLLQKLRQDRNSSSLNYYQGLINREQNKTIKEEKVIDDIKSSRSFDVKLIEENKRILEEKKVKTRVELKRKMILKRIDDKKRNVRIISNTSLTDLIAGFLDTKDKSKYIKQNAKNFKELPVEEQRNLFKIYMDFL